MSEDTFDDPGSAYFQPAEHLERLVLIRVLDYKTDYNDPFNPGQERDGVEVEVTVLDGDEAGEVYTQSRLHQGKLVGALKGKVGRQVIGRLGQGPVGKFGKKPYILETASEADKKVARQFLEASGSAPF
jgi:hypothetical protein